MSARTVFISLSTDRARLIIRKRGKEMSKELCERIHQLRRELEELENENERTTEKCCNTKCSFYKKSNKGHCTWDFSLVEECRDYKAESEVNND